ncbi:MAG: ral secretion pathway protein [Desulfovibrionales bacterium]|nr:ral secretion pathway protein [Desulfovibrionales bacterium]
MNRKELKASFFLPFFAIILSGFLLCAPSTVHAQEENNMQANLENIQLKDFIKFIASYTGRNIVFQENKIPASVVTIFSTKSMTEPELMAIFDQVLNSSNLYSVARGNVLYILSQNEAKDLPSGPQMRQPPPEELVTTVYRLSDDISPQDAATLLTRFSSKFGQVHPIPQARAVLIRDRADYIQKMLALLKDIQHVKPSWKFEVVPMKTAQASEAAQKLTEIFQSMVKLGQIAEPPLISSVDWTNSLIVTGSPDQIQMVVSLLERIDEQGQESVKKELKVYRLLNAKAESAAQVLTALVEGQTSTQTGTGGIKSDTSAPSAPRSTSTMTSASNGQQSLLVSADTDTNSLLVLADPSFQATVEEVIKQLDRTLDQVFIEALILETSLTNSQAFGVEWVGGSGSESSSIGTIGYLNTPSSLMSYAQPVIDGSGAPNVAAAGGGFSMGILGNMIEYNGQYFPTIGALITYTKGVTDFNLLSAPQIMTLDNSEAEIFVGDELPFKTGSQTTSGGSTQVAYDYRDVGVKLTVTPYVNSEKGLIRLDLNQEYNQEGASGADGLTKTINRVTSTSVQLIDGSTMVISGLIENTQNRAQEGIPGLSDLPVFGWLFKRRSSSNDKKTLMVFISARIVRTLDQASAISRKKMERYKKERNKMEQVIEKEFGLEKMGDKAKSQPQEATDQAPSQAPTVHEF